ncbi:hypothetical protein J6590_062622 [Homalodisca vitripennis]|nr:hypothetical protein J6590_062622 [Homalodisca vitripennis]
MFITRTKNTFPLSFGDSLSPSGGRLANEPMFGQFEFLKCNETDINLQTSNTNTPIVKACTKDSSHILPCKYHASQEIGFSLDLIRVECKQWCWTPPHCTTRDPVYIPTIPLTRGTTNIPYHAPQEIGSLLALIRAECKQWCWTPPHCTTRDPVYIPKTSYTRYTNIPYHAPQELDRSSDKGRMQVVLDATALHDTRSCVYPYNTSYTRYNQHPISCSTRGWILVPSDKGRMQVVLDATALHDTRSCVYPYNTSYMRYNQHPISCSTRGWILARSDKGRMQGGVWLMVLDATALHDTRSCVYPYNTSYMRYNQHPISCSTRGWILARSDKGRMQGGVWLMVLDATALHDTRSCVYPYNTSYTLYNQHPISCSTRGWILARSDKGRMQGGVWLMVLDATALHDTRSCVYPYNTSYTRYNQHPISCSTKRWILARSVKGRMQGGVWLSE